MGTIWLQEYQAWDIIQISLACRGGLGKKLGFSFFFLYEFCDNVVVLASRPGF
jgi:hypothetical protein